VTTCDDVAAISFLTTAEPMKPAPPVTNTVEGNDMVRWERSGRRDSAADPQAEDE
jgi:hypothetical protein